MSETTRRILVALTAALLLAPLAALHVAAAPPPTSTRQAYPASDPSNAAGWILNKEMSDEFEGRDLDTSKWLVKGRMVNTGQNL